MRRFALRSSSRAGPGRCVAAETHRFVPRPFYNTYSFAHPPALRIKPGDRVVTKTIDAAGVDWNGKTVASGPNPQTGPFYIEGAEPGDMLVVTIEKIETNRAMAYSSSLLAPYAVDPAAIAARVDREARRVTWTIDKARGVARLDQADVQPGGIELPLRPMLGCVGVAPARKEAISTATPGAFGGNMDYASMGAGVKVMLPVYEPGALLFLGDGHARQGEGEVVGTGLETSMDVEFTRRAREEEGDRLAADRERDAHHGARQRAPAARGVPARDDRAAALADGRLRHDRARRADVHGTGDRVRDRQRRRSELHRRGEDPQGAAAAAARTRGRCGSPTMGSPVRTA